MVRQLFPHNWINYNHLGVIKQESSKKQKLGDFPRPRTKVKQILIARRLPAKNYLKMSRKLVSTKQQKKTWP
jgi:hypothetical protein